MERFILHCDLNNFFAGVEMLKNPDLVGKAIAVCGDPKKRHGIVLAKSELAKKCGVKTGMPIWQANQLCKDLVIVSTNHADYDKYSRIVQEIYYQYTDLVEPFGCDESWLDVTGSLEMFRRNNKIGALSDIETAIAIANQLRERVKSEVGLTISVGVSWNKTFAKMGSDFKKPDATTVVWSDNYKKLIYPLPVDNLLFIGKKSTGALGRMNITTIGDLANAKVESLRGHFGVNAEKMISSARGDDDSPVRAYDYRRVVKSVGNGTTLSRNLVSRTDIEEVVYLLSEEVAWRMRKKGFKGTTINLSVRNTNLSWSGAQETIHEPTNSSKTIQETSLKIFEKIWELPEPVMSLRVSVSNLVPDDVKSQMSFFHEHDEEKNDKISGVFDKVRKKYGTTSINFGTGLNSEFKMHFEVLDE